MNVSPIRPQQHLQLPDSIFDNDDDRHQQPPAFIQQLMDQPCSDSDQHGCFSTLSLTTITPLLCPDYQPDALRADHQSSTCLSGANPWELQCHSTANDEVASTDEGDIALEFLSYLTPLSELLERY